jgi:hypothetical protein
LHLLSRDVQLIADLMSDSLDLHDSPVIFLVDVIEYPEFLNA